jgi:hypothetical protein
MSNVDKKLFIPFSTGGGGFNFETRIQASFVILMLAGGAVPCFPGCNIKKIELQGRNSGFETDDLIVYSERRGDQQSKKLLCQIKHSISITERDTIFRVVIQAAWNDFNNSTLFTRGKDSFALITGPLSITDIKGVRPLLEHARSVQNADEFFKNVEQTNLLGKTQHDKLKAFQLNLNKANNGHDVSKEDAFEFLRHFYLLGYDLDIKTGVTLSLLQSLIGLYSENEVQDIWGRVVEEVQYANQSAGTITVESLPVDIQAAFKNPYAKTMPSQFIVVPSNPIDWNQIQYASDLAFANFIGSWNEVSDADKEIVGKFADEQYDRWVPKIREILQQKDSPISLKNGIWSIPKRKELWQTLGQRIFDNQLDTFKECVVTVLKENDPRFDLLPEERYAASIQGKVLKHSQYLRKGLAETLALLGNNSSVLSKCLAGKPEAVVVLSIREIFSNSDWVLWGSLNNLLPILAEASPSEFLSAVETALQQNPCPFDELFAQEGKGAFGSNYLTGLLWALEVLAWDELFIVQVTIALGELASHDPGGHWANRPSNSLTTIFLPWFPQTMASIEKRKVSVQTLQRENPTVAWKLLLSLMPNPIQNSSGTSKPKWRMSIPEEYPKEVSQKDYWGQVIMYAEMIVELAEHDTSKLAEITEHLDNFPQPIIEKILEHLSTKEIIDKSENERMPLWSSLIELVSKHERFADTEWALKPDVVLKIKESANKLAPQSRDNLYRRLFSEHDIELFEEKGNWEEQYKKLEESRQSAIKELIDNEGNEAILRFADTVESPWKVGISTGIIATLEMDSIMLPNILESDNKNLVQLASSFIHSRFTSRGWDWVEGLDKTDWTNSQMGCFLSNLPFADDTWKQVKSILGDFEVEYWSRVRVDNYLLGGDLYVAIDKLMEYRRPSSAIRCLYGILYNKKPLDKTRTVHALLSALSTTEPVDSMDGHYIVEIIKYLQDDPTTNLDDLASVEWSYLQLLDRFNRDASPKTLENQLASNPSFFCEVIQHIYRSRKETKTEREPSEQEKIIATNAYRLLHDWRTPPGMQSNCKFSKERLFDWLKSVKELCKESGHLDVALHHIGNVLIYCPPDADGFWINRGAAEALNARDAEEIREGYITAIINSRGAHWVDPSGKPEIEFSTKYKKQAEDSENSGYQRLAVTMRYLSDFYVKEAQRVQEEKD